MKSEVHCACEFFSKLLQSRDLPFQFVKLFRRRLEEILLDRFSDHWDQENPQRGSAYRCIRINKKLDPVVREAAKATGLSDIARYLPAEFTMWIDPSDVSYRIGEDGSICQCSLDFSSASNSWENSSVTTATASTTAGPARRRPTSPPRNNYHVAGRYSYQRRSPSPPNSVASPLSSPPRYNYASNVYGRFAQHNLGGIPVQVRV